MPGTQKMTQDRLSLAVTGRDEWSKRRAGQARGEWLEQPDCERPPAEGDDDPNEHATSDIAGVVGSCADASQRHEGSQPRGGPQLPEGSRRGRAR